MSIGNIVFGPRSDGTPSATDMSELRLRHARDEDVFGFYRWRKAMQPEFNGTPVPALTWEQHIAWFAENLNNPHWYVAEIEDLIDMPSWRTWRGDYRAIGALRYDRGETPETFWVSIVLAPEHRGHGYGTRMLAAPISGLEQATIFARIHNLNLPSIKAFVKAGYVLDRTEGPWKVYRRPARAVLKPLFPPNRVIMEGNAR